LNTDRWFYGVFQSAPDLIRWLAVSPPGHDASLGAVPLELDRQYRFSAPDFKAGSHRLDGVLWTIGSETGHFCCQRWLSIRCRLTGSAAQHATIHHNGPSAADVAS
jgi:hypothetical protein